MTRFDRNTPPEKRAELYAQAKETFRRAVMAGNAQANARTHIEIRVLTTDPSGKHLLYADVFQVPRVNESIRYKGQPYFVQIVEHIYTDGFIGNVEKVIVWCYDEPGMTGGETAEDYHDA